MIPRHVIYCDHYPDGAVEAGSNRRERKPATVSHEFKAGFHFDRLTIPKTKEGSVNPVVCFPQ